MSIVMYDCYRMRRVSTVQHYEIGLVTILIQSASHDDDVSTNRWAWPDIIHLFSDLEQKISKHGLFHKCPIIEPFGSLFNRPVNGGHERLLSH